MEYLTRDAILTAEDLGEADVHVPEWGGSVKIRGISKATQQHFRESAMRTEMSGARVMDNDRLECLLFVNCVVEPKFDESDIDDLREKSARAFDRVMTEIVKLVGGGDEQAERFLAGDVGLGGRPGDGRQDGDPAAS